MTRLILVRSVGVLLSLSAALFATPAVAQLNMDELRKSIVRVEVNGRPSTGFLWQQNDQVVTALHSVSHGGDIWVRCGPNRQRATIADVHKDADLALLTTTAFPSAHCQPLRALETNPPADNQKLYTIGYYAAGHASVSRQFFKSDVPPPETISRIVGSTDNVVRELRQRQSPSVDLEIYAVQGGLLPGMSGAPAFDERGKLIGIVNGGLKQGFADFNWTIPSKHLNELNRNNQGQANIPTGDTDSLFSFAFAEDEPNVVLEYSQGEWQYRWVKTKTMSLAEILETSDAVDLDAVRDLLDDNQQVFGRDAESRMRFDIYEDLDKGLIIALPVGQPLRFTEVTSDFSVLESYVDLRPDLDPEAWDGAIEFEQQRWGFQIPGTNDFATPMDSRYFDAVVADILDDCNEPGVSECWMIEDSRQEFSYPGGNKVLNVGVVVAEVDSPIAYEFYTYAVRGQDDIAFEVHGVMYERPNDLFTCVDEDGIPDCVNSKPAFANLQTMLSVMLSTTSRHYRPTAPMNLSLD